MRNLSLSLIILTPLWISGCATSYDPAEVCTAEWIKPRVERAIDDIEGDTQSMIRTFRKFGDNFADGKTPGPFQLLSLTSSLSRFTNTLQDGRGIKDLRILRDTCNDPNIVSGAMSDFMRDQGLPDGMVRFIEDLDAYQDLIQQGVDQVSHAQTN